MSRRLGVAVRFILTCCAVILLGASSPSLQDSFAPGIPDFVLNRIEELVEQDQYQIDFDEEIIGWNRNHRFRSQFLPNAIKIGPASNNTSWEWQMGLESIRSGNVSVPLRESKLEVLGNRVEYHRGPITEWYINESRGLEQGFTLASQPIGFAKDEDIDVVLKSSGNLSPELKANSQTVNLVKETGDTILTYGSLFAFDSTGRDLPAKISVERDLIILTVDPTNAKYPIVIDPFVQSAKLTATDADAGDQLGRSIAIDGDTVIVGAPGDDEAGGLVGAAYIFVKPISGWSDMTETAKLTPNNVSLSAEFGESVSISGDTVVIGAIGDDKNGFRTGAAYVFEKPVGGWVDMTETAKLTASDGIANDRFGKSVAISGDTIIVGAHWDDDLGDDSGSAYIFERPVGGWADMTETAKFNASDGTLNDEFGTSVSISGDIAVIGSAFSDSGCGCDGAAYVFEKQVSGWVDATETAKLVPSDNGAGHNFGESVSISGDVIVIGANGVDDNGTNSGAVYVFEKPISGWTDMSETAKLLASDGFESDTFGTAVSISGDSIVVGANNDDDNGTSSGSVYLFEKPAGGWVDTTENEKVTASLVQNNYQFGLSVAISGETFLGGAPFEDRSEQGQGAVYVFEEGSEPEIDVQRPAGTSIPSGSSDDVGDREGGVSFTLEYTIQNDGLSDLSLGADAVSFGTIQNASASVLVQPSASIAPGGGISSSTIHITPSAGANFNVQVLIANDDADESPYSFTISGTITAQSALSISKSGSGNGVVFSLPEGITCGGVCSSQFADGTDVQLIAAPNAGSLFEGWSGDCDSNGIVTVTGSTGCIAQFSVISQSSEFIQNSKLLANDGSNSDFFGSSVGVDSHTAVVGAEGNNELAPSAGAAYVFEKDHSGTDNWGQVAKLLPNDGANSDTFGSAVAISSNTVVVGSPLDDDSGINSGSAYVFERNAGGLNAWGLVKKITPSDGDPGDVFGWSIAISGNTIAIASPNTGGQFGAIYVFERDQGGTENWGQVAKLQAADQAGNDALGRSVSISHDTIVAGAPGDDDLGGGSGSAYVFERNQGGPDNWGQVAKLLANDGQGGDRFGSSVSISADTIVVGATDNDDLGSSSGSSYVFERNQGGSDNWGQVAKLLANDGQGGDRFGWSVSISADTIVVGATDNDDLGSSSGSAYVFGDSPSVGLPSNLNISSSSQSIVADGVSQTTITAFFTDNNGFLITDSATINFTADSGALSSSAVNTVNGIATVTLTAPNSPQVVDVFASANGQTLSTAIFFTNSGVTATNVLDFEIKEPGIVQLETTSTIGGTINLINESGRPTITVAEFTANPAGPTSFSANGFFDVHIDDPTGVNNLSVTFCPANGVAYWNGSSWQSVSNQTISGGCTTVFISNTTQPNLTDLSGQIFAILQNPLNDPVNTNPVVGGDPPIWEDIMVFPTPERFEGKDLNGDGDQNDAVLRYQNLKTGQIFNTRIAVSQNHRDIDIYGDNIVFVSRNDSLLSSIRRWFNPSGEIGVYNIRTQETKMLDVWGDRPSIYENTISISGNKVRFYRLDKSELVETNFRGQNQAIWGDWIAFEQTERDSQNSKIKLYNIVSNKVVNTNQFGQFPSIYEDTVVFEHQKQLYYFNIENSQVIDPRLQGQDAIIYGDRFVYTHGRSIFYYDIANSQAYSIGQSGLEPDIYEDTITYYVWEEWQGFDINVDGDYQDPIVRTHIISDRDKLVNTPDSRIVQATSIHRIQGFRNSLGVVFRIHGAAIESSSLEVFGLDGRKVFDSGFVAGNQLRWNLRREDGAILANGVYLYRVIVRGPQDEIIFSEIRKMVVLR